MPRQEYLHLRLPEIVQLLGNSEFYARNPVFLFMKDQGMTSVKDYYEAIRQPKDATCCGEGKQDDRTIVHAAVNSFVRTLKLLEKEGQTDLLDQVKEFIFEQIDFRPKNVVLYHMGADNKTKKMQF